MYMESTLEKCKSLAPSGDDDSWKKSSEDLTDRDGLLSQGISLSKKVKPFWKRHIWAIFCHVILLVLYLTTTASLVAWNSALRIKLRRISYYCESYT